MPYLPSVWVIAVLGVVDELTTGYKFTFDMSKAKDWHYTRINFLNKPEDVSTDHTGTVFTAADKVTVMLHCVSGTVLTLFRKLSFPVICRTVHNTTHNV